MALATTPTFIRRATPAGTTDSICAECLIMVCSAASEDEILRAEQNHSCDPVLLAYWEAISEPDDPRAES